MGPPVDRASPWSTCTPWCSGADAPGSSEYTSGWRIGRIFSHHGQYTCSGTRSLRDERSRSSESSVGARRQAVTPPAERRAPSESGASSRRRPGQGSSSSPPPGPRTPPQSFPSPSQRSSWASPLRCSSCLEQHTTLRKVEETRDEICYDQPISSSRLECDGPNASGSELKAERLRIMRVVWRSLGN